MCQEQKKKPDVLHILYIYNLIMDTKTHTINKFIGKEYENLSAFLLDSDICILGMPENEYKKYSENIRKEYSFVSDIDYFNGRIKVLKNFYNRDNIFFTEQMRDIYQTQAKINLYNEIEDLNMKLERLK